MVDAEGEGSLVLRTTSGARVSAFVAATTSAFSSFGSVCWGVAVSLATWVWVRGTLVGCAILRSRVGAAVGSGVRTGSVVRRASCAIGCGLVVAG